MEDFVRPLQRENYALDWICDGQLGRVIIAKNSLLIGRDPAADISIKSVQASWHHAHIARVGDDIFVTDLGSTNGTFVNGQRLDPNFPVMLNLTDDVRVNGCKMCCVRIPQLVEARPTQQLVVGNELSLTQILIGRSRQCDVMLPYPDVSWQHARLTRQAQGWHIEDLGSRNGTWVNERRISASAVQPEDRVRIGLNRFILDNDHVSYTSDVGQVRLEAIGLTRTVQRNGRSHTLLRSVSLSIEPRELVAIVGASGAGKTTLLLALNGYQPATQGCVRLNGIDYYAHPDLFRTVIGYVPQADIVHTDLRVESALRYAAQLRLPSDTDAAEVVTLVSRVLEEMDLTHRRSALIRTLSGGERKRVNIGVELLTRPSLLFLDEPTTGLDAGLERRIVRQLRTLAAEGRTVVVVTHSVQTFDEYDKVAVMARGGVLAYYGPPRDAPTFFGVSDFAGIYDRINQPGMTGASWGSLLYSRPTTAPAEQSKPPPVPPRVPAVGQLLALLARYAEVIRSDTRNLISWLAQAPAVALILATLFHPDIFAVFQSSDAQGKIPIQDAPRLLFLLAFSLICFGLCNSARELVKEREIYRRERHVALRIGPYILSKILVLSLVSFCQCFVLLLIVGVRVNFGLDGDGLALMLLLLFLGALGAVLLGLLISAWASTSDQAITLIAVLLLLQVIFSGLIPLENMNPSFQCLAALCLTRWTYGGLCGTMDIAKHWTDVGLGSQVHDVFRTSTTMALEVLVVMNLCLFLTLWGQMVIQDRRRK